MQAGRCFASSAAHSTPKSPVPEIYRCSVKKAFFSDPSTYPLIAVMCTAGLFILGTSANAYHNYKDIRINPAKKNKLIRDWGEEHVDSVTKVLTSTPFALHAQKFKDIRYEGLGINHEEGLKGKEAYSHNRRE